MESFMPEQTKTDEIWVTSTEGAELLGYYRTTISRLLSSLVKQPEKERKIRIRKRSNGWEMWLPDLADYYAHQGNKKLHIKQG